MNAVPESEHCFIDGPAGRLEAVIDAPADDAIDAVAVICHPHPQHGGTMHNKVAHMLARAFVRSGFETLRFNFRGTENSDGAYDHGVGELDDALAAVDFMRERRPGSALWLAGFSFGGWVAVRAAVPAGAAGLVSVAPAVERFGGPLQEQPTCPWLILQGDADELVDVAATIAWLNGLEPGPELQVLPGAEHFFHGRLVDLREAVIGFVAGHRDTA